MARISALFVFLIAGLRWLVTGELCDRTNTVDITNGIFHSDGSITFDSILYPSGNWFEVTENGQTIKLGCVCGERKCIWKCCGADEEFLGRECVPTETLFDPTVFRGRDVTPIVVNEHFNFMYGIPCSQRYLVDTDVTGNALYLQENGTLEEVMGSRSLWHLPGKYCLDTMIAAAGNNTNDTRSRLVAAVCSQGDTEDDNPILYAVYAVGLMVSVPLMLATAVIYASIPELRNLHGLCLISYCGGLIVAYTLLAYLKLTATVFDVNMMGCQVIPIFVYYSFQTSFFWLNVMCYDIWRTFRGYKGSSRGKRRDLERFGVYGLYAWGVPLLLTAVTAAMQFANGLPDHIIRPNFGNRRCWFDDWISELVYFMTPVLVLVMSNTTLFTVTAKRIYSIRQETAILKSSESSRSDKLRRDKQRYALYLKLFIVMGINWFLEVISFAIGGSNLYWIVMDLSNMSLGIFIFVIFVWKNKAWTLLRKKFRRVPIRSGTESGTRWDTRSSSAPTEDTRITSDDGAAVRFRDLH